MKAASVSVSFVALSALWSGLCAQEFTDPKPPAVTPPPAESGAAPAEPVAFEGLTFHAPPKPLPDGAVTEDWPRFLGPHDNATSGETRLLAKFPEGGPAKVWEVRKGTGYTSPAVVGGRLLLFHRLDDRETLECLDPETGKRFWETGYPVEYSDRYGYSNGPRASAVVDGGRVYTFGVTGVLSCTDLKTGAPVWRRNLREEFETGSYFFGHGSCPLVFDGRVIVNLGGKGGLCVAAFDAAEGKLLWGTRHEWRASYASPVIGTLRGKPRLLVVAAGESDPPTGGLLCIDPATGELHDAFPWRADKYESVLASSPVVAGENRVYFSDAYEIGGVMLELGEDLKWKVAWKAPEFGMHWMTPLVKDGCLYGFRGRNEPDAWMACHDVANGEEKWRDDPEWSIPMPGNPDRQYRLRFFRGSLLQADGRTWALSELGTLAILNLSPRGVEIVDRTQLFLARSTWSLPVLHRGLLYISQHETDPATRETARLICYDLRGE